MKNVSIHALYGCWTHSHEEDFGNHMVLRPSTFQFPPSRGRYQYFIENGGNLRIAYPGPTDKQEAVGGTWSLEEDRVLVLRLSDGNFLRFKIVSVDSEQLVMTKV